MPFAKVKRIARLASIGKPANVTSIEYIIEELPRILFDVFDLGAE
jgi:hypothetical protein